MGDTENNLLLDRKNIQVANQPNFVAETRWRIRNIWGVTEPLIEMWSKIRSLVWWTENLSNSMRDQIMDVMEIRTASNDPTYMGSPKDWITEPKKVA